MKKLVIAALLFAVPGYAQKIHVCADLLARVELKQKIRAPENFRVVIATNKFILGSDLPEDLTKATLRLKVLDRNTFEEVGTMRVLVDTEMVHGVAKRALRVEPTTNERLVSGVATEAKFAVMDYGFEVLGVEGSYAAVFKTNIASLRLHEKLGYDVLHDNLNSKHFWISREKFAAQKAAIGENGMAAFVAPRTAKTMLHELRLDREGFDSLLRRSLQNLEAEKKSLPDSISNLMMVNKKVIARLVQEKELRLSTTTSNLIKQKIEREYQEKLAVLDRPLATGLFANFLKEDLVPFIEQGDIQKALQMLYDVESNGLPGADYAARAMATEFLGHFRPLIQKIN